MANHADLVVNGNFEKPTIITDTTDSMDCKTEEQIWQMVSLQLAFRFDWSEGKMAAPAT